MDHTSQYLFVPLPFQDNADATIKNKDFSKSVLPLGISNAYLTAVKPHGMFRTFVRSLKQQNGQAVSKNLDYKYKAGRSTDILCGYLDSSHKI